MLFKINNEKAPIFRSGLFEFGAENETRTRDINLGKVTLYQLSYFRILQLFGAQYRIRTDVGFSSNGFAIRRIQPDSANCA